MAWPAIAKPFKQEEFGKYVAGLIWNRWRPIGITLHNTALPTIDQWEKTAAQDLAAGRYPGTSRIRSLESFFKDQQHWSGGPHLFIDENVIWVFNPLTEPGVHSPSWNSTHIGIECIGDYAKEDDDSGPGLKIKLNAIYAMSVLCSTLGIPAVNPYDPDNIARSIRQPGIFLHKQDPKTTHDCPGQHMAQDIGKIIDDVAALMAGGEHDSGAVAVALGVAPAAPTPAERRGVVTADGLNLRRGPAVTEESIGSFPKGVQLAVLGEARNGQTAWLKVRSPLGYVGWVSGRYVKID